MRSFLMALSLLTLAIAPAVAYDNGDAEGTLEMSSAAPVEGAVEANIAPAVGTEMSAAKVQAPAASASASADSADAEGTVVPSRTVY